jgi:hypothetical protein
VLTLRTVCLTALGLTAASPAAAQINIQVNNVQINNMRHPLPPYLGTVGAYRPPPPMFPPPAVGTVRRSYVVTRRVPSVVSLRPNLYPTTYMSRFNPGYQTVLVGNIAYHYYPALPPGAAFTMVGGVGYYQAGGVWYQPYAMGGQNLFLVVPPPF